MTGSTRFGFIQDETDTVEHAAGSTIFDEGDAATEMYAVRSGSVEISVGGRVVETVDEGEVFGELALLDTHVRSAKAVARTDCRLVSINEARFLFLVQQHPSFAVDLLRVLAGRLRARTAG